MVKASWLPSLPSPAAWMEHASCAEVDPELFFIEGTYREQVRAQALAKSICKRCPVAAECLATALEQDQRYGIWGGTDPSERSEIRRRNR